MRSMPIYQCILFSLLIIISNLTFSQNVGIGNSNPKAKLDIYGNLKISSTPADSASSLNGLIRYGINPGEYEGYNGTGWIPLHSLWTKGNGNNIYKPSGTVGVNWANPTGLLGISSSADTDTNLVLRRNAPGTFLKAMDANLPSKAFVIQLDTNRSGSVVTESFARLMVSNSYPNQFTIHENGLIGLGTKRPCELPGLESGLVEFTSNSYTTRSDWVMRVASDPLGCAALLLSKSAGTPDVPTRVNNVNGNNHALGLVSFLGYQVEGGFGQFVRSAEITGWVDGDPTLENDLPGRITFHTRPYGFYNMIPPERMRLDHNGYLGIGTTNPGEILDINGRMVIRNSSTPASTANKLYAKNGNLYWGNNLVGIENIASPSSFTILTSGSGTYTVPADIYVIVVEVIGGGGGGNGGTTAANGHAIAGGGGGGGGYAKKRISTTPNATFSYSVGTAGAGASTTTAPSGGNTTFSTLTANGGSGGLYMPGGTTAAIVSGGNGGNASGGDINIAGGDGGIGYRISGSTGLSGTGGTSMFSQQAASEGVPTSQGYTNGNNAKGYGGGGSGGTAMRTSTNYTCTGGNGSAGIIIITEFK